MQTYLKKYTHYYHSLIMLGFPIIIGQLGAIVTGFADTIMVGLHSTEELAASSFVNNVINAFIVLGTGFSFNLTPVIGQNLAKNKKTIIGGWLKNSIIANLSITACIITVLIVLYLNLEVLGQPKELLPLIRPYYIISLISIIFIMFFNSFRQFVEGIANPFISMWILLIGNFLNIIGNYVLIYGKFGFPELGLYGAGISTFCSRLIMLLLFILIFILHKDYQPYRNGFSIIPINKDYLKKLFSIGWPIGFQQGLEAGTFCVTAIMVGWLGSLFLAAHQVAITISTVSFTIFLGLGTAVAIRASYFKGANEWVKVRNVTLAGIHLALIIMCFICTFLFLTKSSLGYLFTDDESVIQIVSLIIPILMIYQFVDCIQIVLTNALRGLADVKAIMWISVFAYFIIAIPAGYLLGFVFSWGIAGVWMAYPFGFACAVILLGLRAKKLINSHL